MTVIMQMIDKLTRRNALLVLLQKRKVGDVMVEGSLGSGDCEIIEFKILRELRKTKSKIATLNFRRTDFGLFRNLARFRGRLPWRIERPRRVGWYLLKAQEESILIHRNLSKRDSKPAWISKMKVEVEWVTSEDHRNIA